MRRIFVVVLVFSVISLLFNIYLFDHRNIANKTLDKEQTFQEDVKRYPLLSPRIMREAHPDFIFNFLDLRTKIHQQLDPLGDDIALYFEYLPNGTSINVNAGSDFFAASLFKLPVVMAYFRHKERVGNEPEMKVKLTREMIDNRFGDLWKKGEGYEIGLDEVDIAMLKAIITRFNGGPVGIDSLSSSIGEEVSTIEDVYEPYLLQIGMLKRTNRGRVVTEKAYEHLKIDHQEGML